MNVVADLPPRCLTCGKPARAIRGEDFPEIFKVVSNEMGIAQFRDRIRQQIPDGCVIAPKSGIGVCGAKS